MEKDSVKINNKTIYFFYKRKKIKNIVLRVNKDNEIVILLPKRASLNTAKEFIARKYDWIQKVIEKRKEYSDISESKDYKAGELLYILGNPYIININQGRSNSFNIDSKYINIQIKEKYICDKRYIQEKYEEWLKKLATEVFTKETIKYQEITKDYRIPYPEIVIRKMKSRWGSCYTTKNKIVLNLSLIKTPIECVEYVVLHELSHFKYPNHSKNFYGFIEKIMPDWKERRKLLNKKYTKIIN